MFLLNAPTKLSKSNWLSMQPVKKYSSKVSVNNKLKLCPIRDWQVSI